MLYVSEITISPFTLLELIIDHRGLTPKKLGGDWSTVGYRAVSAKSIKNGQLVNEEQMNLLPVGLYKKWMKDEIQYGDIFLTSEAPLGEHLIWKSQEKLVLSQRIFGLRTNKELLDPFFLNLFIDSIYFQHELKSRESGSVVSGIKQSELLKVKLISPPLSEQRAIAAVLSSLDDKIELLRVQNKTLEATAQEIFKEWFVNFNFPGASGKMIESELGKIPEGWRVHEFRDLFAFIKGKKPNSTSETFISGFLPQILIDTLDGGKIIFADSKNTVLSTEDDLVMVMDGASSGRIEFGYSGIIGSTLSLLDFKKGCKAILYLFLKNKEGEIKGSTTGSAIPHTDKEKIYQYSIALPSKNLGELESVLNSFRKKVILNRKSIQTLSTLRDTLLPKLMKGEARVKIFKD